MTDRETRRLSFGSVAENYDRYRPAPPPQALDWLIPDGADAILDLAAGTGLVTRGLAGRARRVVAVEPDERMRAVLAARCPEAEVLAGRGESRERLVEFSVPMSRAELAGLRSTRLPG